MENKRVVRAGLLYQLTLGQRLSGSEAWEIRIIKPGKRSLQSLALDFVDKNLASIDRALQLATAEELLAQGSEGLRRLVQVSNTPRMVLVVDQFEEVFTLCEDREERQKFFDCLLAPVAPDFVADEADELSVGMTDNISASSVSRRQSGATKLSIILTMRADFFGKCVDYGELAQRIQEQDLRNWHKQWRSYTASHTKQLRNKHGNSRTF